MESPQQHRQGELAILLRSKPPVRVWSWPALASLLLLQLWAAHTVVFFCHEYAHTFVAWMLGWKANPLALHYPQPSLVVFLIQLGIDQDVNEDPIFSSGHGRDAAIIAAAGMVIGNGLITYSLGHWGCAVAKRRNRAGTAMFFYWIIVASVGNLIDYVPIRTFSDEGDMASVRRGFDCSSWTVLVVLGIPTLVALVHFCIYTYPSVIIWLFPSSAARRGLMVTLTAIVLFGFYGGAGLLEDDLTSQRLSEGSLGLIVPLVATIAWVRIQRLVSN